MNHQEQFTGILEKEREAEVVPFFKSLHDEEKQSLISFLQQVSKEYLEYAQDKKFGSLTFARKASDQQMSILTLAAFICFNKKEFEKAASLWSVDKNKIEEVLTWYCPKWLSDHINGYSKNEFIPSFINYDWIMELSERGLITPTKELIVKILPPALFEPVANHKFLTKPENLLRRRITLEEHIWYFFETENNIYLSDRYLQFADNSKKDENQWIRCLSSFSSQGKVDRRRLLQESILGTTRNFNKLLAGWFAELFTTLDPSKEELLLIQQHVLNALNSNHTKPINVVLHSIKKIIDESGFKVNSFLESTPLLLSSETKTIVHSTLAILEKIAKKHSDKRAEICIATCQAFLHADEEIQLKASKLIQKYGDSESRNLKEALLNYTNSLLVKTRNDLAKLLTSTDGSTPEQKTVSEAELLHDTDERPEIREIDSFDELIFLSSQAFDNNRSYHVDLLPAALIRLTGDIQGSTIGKFEPALQRAFKVVMDDWTSTAGQLDHLLATFFIDYSRILIKRYPSEAAALTKLHKHYTRKATENMGSWSQDIHPPFPLKGWKLNNRDTVYDLHKNLLLISLEKIDSGDSLPLLSTPTHEPAFISPDVLIKRLRSYQEKNRTPDLIDFQVAVSRCDLLKGEDHLGLAAQSLKGELKNILLFLLKPDGKPEPPFTLQSVWVVSGIAKDKTIVYDEFKDFSVIDIPRAYLTGQFTWKFFDKTNYKELQVDLDKNTKDPDPPKNEPPVIYEFLSLTSQYLTADHNDIARIIYLTPNNPEPALAQVISKALTYNTFAEASDQKLVASTVEALIPLNVRYGEMGHLFIGTCMLSVDKTIQSFAAELWSRGIRNNSVDTTLLGEIIGKHESVEFAPLKRLTDLMSGTLINISTLHNNQLEILIVHILLELPGEPIPNLKKLLEIYYEIISINRSTVPDQLLQHMKAWSTSGSLKKVLNSISQLKQHVVG